MTFQLTTPHQQGAGLPLVAEGLPVVDYAGPPVMAAPAVSPGSEAAPDDSLVRPVPIEFQVTGEDDPEFASMASPRDITYCSHRYTYSYNGYITSYVAQHFDDV